jgi:hypothetical protein
LRLQTIKRNRKEINESLGTSKNEKTATTELVRSTKRRSKNVWGNKLTGCNQNQQPNKRWEGRDTVDAATAGGPQCNSIRKNKIIWRNK